MPPAQRKTVVIALVITLLIGFWGGFRFAVSQGRVALPGGFGTVINQTLGQPSNIDFSLFWDVWEKLHDKYVDRKELDDQELIYGAIEGMVNKAGDPYTAFLKPETNKKFQEDITGSFGGIGIEIGMRDGVPTVIAPLKDTPAAAAGLKAGDKIMEIDGKSTENISIEEAVTDIRGKKGTSVVLNISREGQDAKDYTLVRDTILVPSVEWKLLDGDVAYIQIFTFSQNVDKEFRNAAQAVLKSSAKSLIVDLRNDPGGLLDAAIDLAGWFLNENDLVVIEDFGDGTKNEFRSSGNSSLKGYPTIILLNGGSASASEILAGAVHDNNGTRLLGEKSFGKGSVQELSDFHGGSSLKVTIAKWLTPKGVSISDEGLTPDIEIKLPTDEESLKQIEIGAPGKDPQLDRAIELLR